VFEPATLTAKQGNPPYIINMTLFNVARATSAAPTYFPPREIGNDLYIDGGVFCNNPSLCAIDYLLRKEVKSLAELDLSLLSLSTGKVQSPKQSWYLYLVSLVSKLLKPFKPQGFAIAISVIKDAMMNFDIVHNQCATLLSHKAVQKYVRIETSLGEVDINLDDARQVGKATECAEKEQIKEACELVLNAYVRKEFVKYKNNLPEFEEWCKHKGYTYKKGDKCVVTYYVKEKKNKESFILPKKNCN